jgi:hypothetical protein
VPDYAEFFEYVWRRCRETRVLQPPQFDLLGIILRTSSCDQPDRKEKN